MITRGLNSPSLITRGFGAIQQVWNNIISFTVSIVNLFRQVVK